MIAYSKYIQVYSNRTDPIDFLIIQVYSNRTDPIDFLSTFYPNFRQKGA